MTAAGLAPVEAAVVRRASAAPALRIGTIHGLEETAGVWDRLVDLLPPRVEVHAFGLPWDGRHGSAWAREREPRRWVEQALALVPDLPPVLVAHSFGANALLDHLQVRGTVGVEALVLVSPFYRPTYECFEWGVVSYYLNDFHRILEEGIRVRLPREPNSGEVLAGMGERVRDRIGALGWLRFFELFARTPGLDLARLAVPCLVIGGERDFASFPDDCRALARDLPLATVEVLEGCGHFPMLERPDAMADSVNRFLQRLPLGAVAAGGRSAMSRGL